MPTTREIADLREHLQRYRAVTLQVLDLVADEQLGWRPVPDAYTLGEQLLHIAQAEDFHVHGLFEGDYDTSRVRLPDRLPGRDGLRAFFERVRDRTLDRLDRLSADDLDAVPAVPDGPPGSTLRSWLWFLLEHELHHRGQVWLYLRLMGLIPPFYAAPLPPGERPDIAARREIQAGRA